MKCHSSVYFVCVCDSPSTIPRDSEESLVTIKLSTREHSPPGDHKHHLINVYMPNTRVGVVDAMISYGYTELVAVGWFSRGFQVLPDSRTNADAMVQRGYIVCKFDTVVILFHYFWVYFTYLNASHYDILFSFTLFSSLNKCFIIVCLVLLYSHCI